MKNLLSMKTPVLALFISLVAFGACVSNKQTQPSTDYTPVSYTHLTLPTKRIV